MGNLLSWVLHDWMRGVDKLVEVEFVEESVGLFLVSVKDGWFFSLEGIFTSLDRVRLWQ